MTAHEGMSLDERAALVVFDRFHIDHHADVLARAACTTPEELVRKWPAEQIAKRMLLKQGTSQAEVDAVYAQIKAETAGALQEPDARTPEEQAAPPTPTQDERPKHAVDSLSARALDTWRRCPRLWAWLYPLGNTVPAGPSAEVGKALHDQAALAIEGKAKDVHPAAAIAAAEIQRRAGNTAVEVWKDDGFLCGRADVVFHESKIYNRRVVKDWKFVVSADDEGLQPARDDGLQPEVYRHLFDAHLVEVTTILADGTEWNTEIAEPKPLQLAAAMLDIWSAQEKGCKGIGEYGCRGKPGHNSACMLYGECPLRAQCIAAGEGGEVNMRERWDALSQAKKEYVLQLAQVKDFDELTKGLAAEVLETAIEQQELAPEPKPKKVRKTKTKAPDVEYQCTACGASTPLQGLCAICQIKGDMEENAPDTQADAPTMEDVPDIEEVMAMDLEDALEVALDSAADAGKKAADAEALEALDAYLLAHVPYNELPEDLRDRAWESALRTSDPQTVFAAGVSAGKSVAEVVRAVLGCKTPAPAWFLVKVRKWARGEQ